MKNFGWAVVVVGVFKSNRGLLCTIGFRISHRRFFQGIHGASVHSGSTFLSLRIR